MAASPAPGPASPAGGTLRPALRHNVLIVITALVFLALGAANTALLDNVGLAGEKRDILRKFQEAGTILPESSVQMLDLRCRALLAAATPESFAQRKRELEDAFDRVLESFPSIVEVGLTRGGEVLVARSKPGRMRENNDWSICLLARESRLLSTRTVSTPGIEPTDPRFARVMLVFTVPPRDARPPEMQAELRAAVKRYRAFAALLWVGLGALYAMVLTGLLLPVRRVVQTLDSPHGSQPPIIGNPRSLLELAYNAVACDAAVARMARELREEPGQLGPAADPAVLLERASDIAATATGTHGFQVFTLAPGRDGGRWNAVAAFSESGVPWLPGKTFTDALAAELAGGLAEGPDGRLAARALAWSDGRGHWRHAVLAPVMSGADALHVLVLHLEPVRHSPPSPWELELVERLAREVRFAIGALELRRRLILQEKSKANISLSRNLGHDLTNIIATAKLELMTVANFLRMDPGQIGAAPKKAEIFREALGSLLNNVRFMQEVVNLYRSFSYLQRPKFEQVSPAELAKEVVELFRLSVSGNFPAECEVEPGLPPIEVEPRLLRLALFNLLTNAVEAMRRASSTGAAAGTLRVAVARDGPDAVTFAVQDTGPGIRNAEGRLLEPDEVGVVFRLGYTTKGEGEGEGLGLAWVQTIVTEFHSGRLVARNRPEGGAEFVLRLPIRKEAQKESTEAAPQPVAETPAPHSITREPRT